MTAPVRVVHLITRLDVGGAQETAVRTCAGLDRSRYSPLLLCGPDAGSGGSLREAAVAAGVEVDVIDALRGPISPQSDLAARRAVRDRLHAEQAAILHTHSSKAGVVGRTATLRGSRPWAVVHTVHGWSFHPTQPAPVALAYRAIERWLARRTDALVVVAQADREEGLRRRIGRPETYALVRSGIDLQDRPGPGARRRSRGELGWSDDDVVVASVGRLEAQKDPVGLVDSFAAAHRRAPTLRLALVGSGSLEPSVRARVHAAGLDDRVDLLGLRSDVSTVLAGADAFALASRWEGLPRAALEAARAGLAVVATATGGMRELLDEGDAGRLVPVGDEGALADALVELAEDPSVRALLGGRVAARLPEFSEVRMVSDTEALYERLLAARGLRLPVNREAT